MDLDMNKEVKECYFKNRFQGEGILFIREYTLYLSGYNVLIVSETLKPIKEFKKVFDDYRNLNTVTEKERELLRKMHEEEEFY